jgi:hypothetical protein
MILAPLFMAAMLVMPLQGSSTCKDDAHTCLLRFFDIYLKALEIHKPDELPLAPNVKFTEDSKELKIGESHWKTVIRVRGPQLAVADVRQGVVGGHVVVEEKGSAALLVVRLKVVNEKITEIETLVTHNQQEGAIFAVDEIKLPSPAMNAVPYKSQLNTREEAIRIATLYPAGLKAGSFVTVDVPFAADAYRFENGRLMAGPGCTFAAGCDNIKTQRIPKLSSITYRVAAVDEEQGIVWLRQDFGPGSIQGPANALIAWEAFKVYGGQIHAVEAFMKVMPAGTPSGWD